MSLSDLKLMEQQEQADAIENIQNGNYTAAESNIAQAKAYANQINLLTV